MKKSVILAIVALVILVLPALGGQVAAGVEPSPFVPAEFKRIAQRLDVINFRAGNVLNMNPDLDKGSLIGVITKLEIMDDHLERMRLELQDVLDNSPYAGGYEAPQEYNDALSEVSLNAFDVQVTYREMVHDLYYNNVELYNELFDYINSVHFTAVLIHLMANDFLSTPPDPGGGV